MSKPRRTPSEVLADLNQCALELFQLNAEMSALEPCVNKLAGRISQTQNFKILTECRVELKELTDRARALRRREEQLMQRHKMLFAEVNVPLDISTTN